MGGSVDLDGPPTAPDGTGTGGTGTDDAGTSTTDQTDVARAGVPGHGVSASVEQVFGLALCTRLT